MNNRIFSEEDTVFTCGGCSTIQDGYVTAGKTGAPGNISRKPAMCWCLGAALLTAKIEDGFAK